MKLKRNVALVRFAQSIARCQAPVRLKTAEGDDIDLKSDLSALVLAVLAESPELLLSAVIECEDAEDYKKLEDYLE